MDRSRTNERQLMDSLEGKVTALERTMALKDSTIAELELRITSLESTSYDGTLLWRINDFARRRQEAVQGRVTSIYSPAFYTSRTGARPCACVVVVYGFF
jgi:TNF receptor-associated factor 2